MPATKQDKPEIRPLTGVRGVAAFLVMVYHFAYNPAFAFLLAIPKLHKSYLCVDLFFILSGFVLALNYKKLFKEQVRLVDYGSFLTSRFARIYPAYFIVLLPSYIQQRFHLFDNPALRTGFSLNLFDVVSNVLLIQSWGFDIHSVVGVSWSVSTEILAYILFPFLLQVVVKRGTYATVLAAGASIGTLLLICYLSVQAQVASHVVLGTGPLDVSAPESGFLPLMRCLAGFFLGLVAYRISQIAVCKELLSTEVASAVVLSMLVIAVSIDQSDVLIVVTLFFLVICLYYNGKIVSGIFANRVIHHLGQISYSLYLVHSLFRGFAAHWCVFVERHYGYSLPYLFAFLGIAGSWAFAYLSYRFVEIPCRRYINKSIGPRLTNKSELANYRYKGLRVK